MALLRNLCKLTVDGNILSKLVAELRDELVAEKEKNVQPQIVQGNPPETRVAIKPIKTMLRKRFLEYESCKEFKVVLLGPSVRKHFSELFHFKNHGVF